LVFVCGKFCGHRKERIKARKLSHKMLSALPSLRDDICHEPLPSTHGTA
jgi:hypothetical protein